MLDYIRNFNSGSSLSTALSDLQVLTNRLEALHAVLKRPQDTWWQLFQGKVNTLGEVLGVLLYEERTKLDEIGKKIVAEALQEITVPVQSANEITE